MIPADENFDGTWPFPPCFCEAAGFRQHYVDVAEASAIGQNPANPAGQGPVTTSAPKPTGDAASRNQPGPDQRRPVILLHGQPTWGYIWRNFIPPLARHYRVIVPDHMGFGKSETPADRDYTLRTHVANLTALIQALDLRDITLVMQDWGGPIGVGYAVRNPHRIHSLVLMNTVCGYGSAGRRDLPNPLETPWFRWIRDGLPTGRTQAVLSQLGSTILSVLQIVGLERLDRVDPTFIRAYAAPFQTPADCRGAIEFPLDLALGRIRDFVREGAGGVAALQAKPALLIEGMRDRAIPPALALADFSALWPQAPIIQVLGAGHYIQEDAPEVVVPALLTFLGMLDAAAVRP